MNFRFAGIIISLLLATGAAANELVRPEKFTDFSNQEEVTVERAVQVLDVQVAWANYDAIKRDFPALSQSSNEQINQWLLQNFSYVGDSQSLLNGIRNSPIPVGTGGKPAIRPVKWGRSAILEAHAPNGEVMGMVDAKGFGFGAQSYSTPHEQVEEFAQKKSNPDLLNKMRTRGHSDGLMSMGEAIAETSRQMAAQKLFEMSGLPLETVEAYAILALPFDILKDNGTQIPAALYLRQAHQGRASGLAVPPSIYVDHHGSRQMTEAGTAVDMGGVLITDQRLQDKYGPSEPGNLDAQKSKPWQRGHEVALAWKRGDRDAVFVHIAELLKPLEAPYSTSPEVKARALELAEKSAYLESLKGKSYQERSQLIKKWNETNVRNLESKLSHSDPSVRASALRAIGANLSAVNAMPLIANAMKDPDPHVRASAAAAMIDSSDNSYLPLLEKALDDVTIVRQKAALALRSKDGPYSIKLLEKALNDKNIEVRMNALSVLGTRSDIESLSLIKKGLKDYEIEVIKCAARALYMRNDPESQKLYIENLNHLDPAHRGFLADALSFRSDPESLPLVEEALRNTNAAVRFKAACALSVRTDRESLRLFKIALDSNDPFVHAATANALSVRRDSEALPLFEKAFRDAPPYSEFRRNLARSLSARSEPESLHLFAEAFADPDPVVRENAAFALRVRSDSGAIPIFETALRDPNVNVRRAAARSLEARSDPESYHLFEIALGDTDSQVRQLAAHALGARKDRASLPLFEKAMRDADPVVRIYAAKAKFKAMARFGSCLSNVLLELHR